MVTPTTVVAPEPNATQGASANAEIKSRPRRFEVAFNANLLLCRNSNKDVCCLTHHEQVVTKVHTVQETGRQMRELAC